MNEEAMKNLWQQPGSLQVALTPQTVIEVREQMNKLDAKIKQRDRQEIIVALCMAPLFAGLAFVFDDFLVKVGCIIIALYSFIVIFFLKVNQKKAIEKGQTLKEQVKGELLFLKRQRLLLKNVLYWYLLPLFIGIGLFHYGSSGHWISFAVLMLFTTGVYIYIWRLNQTAVREELDPAIGSLEDFLYSMEGV